MLGCKNFLILDLLILTPQMHFCHNIVRLKRHYVKIRHLVYACINAKDSLNTVLSTKLTFFFVTKHMSKTFFNTFSVFYILIIYFYNGWHSGHFIETFCVTILSPVSMRKITIPSFSSRLISEQSPYEASCFPTVS